MNNRSARPRTLDEIEARHETIDALESAGLDVNLIPRDESLDEQGEIS